MTDCDSAPVRHVSRRAGGAPQRVHHLCGMAALPVLLGLLGAAIGAVNFRVELSPSGDNVEYLLLARAVLQGDGFVQLSSPTTPPETKRLPGYPLFLAACMRLVGQDLALLKCSSLALLGLATMALWYLLLGYLDGSRSAAAAVILLTLLNVSFLAYASVTMSEMLFVLLGVLAMLALEKAGRTAAPRHLWAVLPILPIVGACYVRPNGLALIPAAACFLAVRRRWALAVLVPLACLVGMLPWFVRERSLGSGSNAYVAAALHSDADKTRKLTPAALAERVAAHAATRLLQLGQLVLAVPPRVEHTAKPRSALLAARPDTARATQEPARAANPAGTLRRFSRYLLAAIVIMGGALLWRRGGSAAHWYAVWTLLLLIVGPYTAARYLVPLLPIWNWFLIGSLQRLGEVGASRWRTIAKPLATAAVIGACVLAAASTGMDTATRVALNLAERGRPYDAPGRYRLAGDDWVRYVEAALWLRQHTPADAVIVARKPYHLYWLTGRHAVVEPLWAAAGPPMWQTITANLRHGPVYVVEDAFGDRYNNEDTVGAELVPTLLEHRSELSLVFTSAPPVTAVWQVLSPGAATVSPQHRRPDSGLPPPASPAGGGGHP